MYLPLDVIKILTLIAVHSDIGQDRPTYLIEVNINMFLFKLNVLFKSETSYSFVFFVVVFVKVARIYNSIIALLSCYDYKLSNRS